MPVNKNLCRYHDVCDGHVLYFNEPSLTKQEFKDECDMNLIIERASRGADIAHLNSRVPQFGDFSNVPDYRTALDLVNKANGLFMALPALVRERFANDAGRFLVFMNDPKNAQEAVRLGLAEVRKADGKLVKDDLPEGNPGDTMGDVEPPKSSSGAKKSKPHGGDDE